MPPVFNEPPMPDTLQTKPALSLVTDADVKGVFRPFALIVNRSTQNLYIVQNQQSISAIFRVIFYVFQNRAHTRASSPPNNYPHNIEKKLYEL